METTVEKQQWLQVRKLGIGGSDCACILGLNPYKSAYQVWKDKVSDEPEQVEENDAMHFGNVLEDTVAAEYTRRTGRKVMRDNHERVHKEFSMLRGNIDRLIVSTDETPTGILEIKTTNSFAYKQWENGIPLMYYCQIMHYLSITGLKWAEFAILIDGRAFETLRIERDEEYITRQNQALVAWWNAYVMQLVPPPLTAVEYSFVETKRGASKEADEDMQEIYLELLEAKRAKKAAEEKLEALQDKVKLFLQDSEILTIGQQPIVTWKAITSNRFDAKEFEKKYPELKQQFTKPQIARRFEIKE